VAAPITRVLTGVGTIATDTCTLALNGSASSSDATDQGTGNYAAAALSIFARNPASGSLWFGGQGFRQFVCFGPALSAGETATVESWVNESAKAY
jgi:hypothetical protein